ncbi:DNA-binding proteins Bright/BRCAA1/RBP1 and proteins containing BRIGHT domain [Ascochyta rabiei]|uniref:DNA-binding proteins Bright/BRCAA1/RBP1 and proteins containing BRIGHT domain n=1 Tax=Didymella rabiei TaxID=5454 RepID=UPI00190160C9|nr:DNA-binding proteins Bright/BRCAA1/RBP1 and proteins containing BRIGHT domain [Ascochyta rabiei]UPX12689.1 DNA-binding proteins Bright/BRCAA1/RBP1 and proteins containing BRIGHT domain [Ascochyta rabiei]
MATMVQKPISNIAAAFAAQQASYNIPVPHDGVLAASTAALPTPPSSISPTLSAHKRRPAMPIAGRVDTPETMDFDLQDAVEHAAAQDQPSALSKEALAGLDATRQITAAMLAKHHLPAIIVGHGAMPIREMMAHLTHSVPGFSGLAPAKARRLVVAALEHRAGGGMHGEVKFEKVGWGRWSVAGSSQPRGGSGATPPASVGSTASGLQIPKLRQERDTYQGSWNAGSWSPPHKMDEDEEMADQMSLDGSDDSADSDSASDMDLGEDLDDDTDQEDWSTMGPQVSRETRRGPRREHRDYNYLSRTQSSNPRFRSTSTQGHSLPQGGFQGYTSSRTPVMSGTPLPSLKFTASPGVSGSGAERDAIEALIAMGSMPRS